MDKLLISERKAHVYLDTSVISYLDQEDSPEKMAETIEVWEILKRGVYDIFISTRVLDELNKCKEPKRTKLFSKLEEIHYTLLPIDDEVVKLANKFIEAGILKRKSVDDCQHIAAAILANCDIIVSWNFKHIFNYKTIRGVRSITVLDGYKDIWIYPPTALFEEV
ncbi:MAG: PIN domain-containing protein [Selenomonadaceae bacterium]|nr:PIN domain-containing protein [Selenomonadaceae bacterium]